MSNETAGANGGRNTSLAAAKDLPVNGDKLIFPFQCSLTSPYASQLLQFWTPARRPPFIALPPNVPAISLLFQTHICQHLQQLDIYLPLTPPPSEADVSAVLWMPWKIKFLWKRCLISTAKAKRFPPHILRYKWDLKWRMLFIVKEGEIKEFSQKGCVGRRGNTRLKEHIYELVGGLCSGQIKACVRVAVSSLSN